LKISQELFQHFDPLDYIELKIELKPWNEDIAGILVAMLSSIGFESFTNDEVSLYAYIRKDKFIQAEVELILHENLEGKIGYSVKSKTILAKNWNEIWESNFEQVIIDEICQVRAPFHEENKEVPFSILIEPKMSFGTGHHATTALMVSSLLELNIKCKVVLDMGCGTGLLGILASKMGAHSVTAIDIDDWAFNNSKENAVLNLVPNMNTLQGDVSLIKGLIFNIILANINRNVLLQDISAYAASLSPEGILLLSGFFESDSEDITACAQLNGLRLISSKNKNNWAALLFSK
jgi:ribosomal protein L11 methyltransferase